MKKKPNEMKFIFERFKDEDFTDFGKVLGQGAFGEVRDVNYKDKQMAGKIIKRDNNESGFNNQNIFLMQCYNL